MNKFLFSIIAFSVLFGSCQMTVAIPATSSLSIVNALSDNSDIAVNLVIPPIPYYRNSNFISFGSGSEYGLLSGTNPVSIVSSDDSTKPIFSGIFNLSAGGLYSLYISGQNKAIDTVYIQDNIPAYQDSSSGLRFINLSPDNHPLTVNIVGNDSSQKEFGPLVYKQISKFKSYNASNIGGSTDFEIRDPVLPNPISTFSWNYQFGKNYTIVISGSADSSSLTPIHVFQVPNF